MRSFHYRSSWKMATQAKQAKADGKNNHENTDEQAGKLYLWSFLDKKTLLFVFPYFSSSAHPYFLLKLPFFPGPHCSVHKSAEKGPPLPRHFPPRLPPSTNMFLCILVKIKPEFYILKYYSTYSQQFCRKYAAKGVLFMGLSAVYLIPACTKFEFTL